MCSLCGGFLNWNLNKLRVLIKNWIANKVYHVEFEMHDYVNVIEGENRHTHTMTLSSTQCTGSLSLCRTKNLMHIHTFYRCDEWMKEAQFHWVENVCQQNTFNQFAYKFNAD